MPRRSRQTIDRSKGGNYVRLTVWVPRDVRKLARKGAKTAKTTLTAAIEAALRALGTVP